MNDCGLLEWVFSTYSQSKAMKEMEKKKKLGAYYLKGHSFETKLK